MDRKCITHHYACDCREKMFKDIYYHANMLLVKIGMDGSINFDSQETSELMHVLAEIDHGTFDMGNVFDNEKMKSARQFMIDKIMEDRKRLQMFPKKE